MRSRLAAIGARAAAAALVSCAAAAALAQPGPPDAAPCEACHGPQGNSLTPAIPSIAGQPKLFIENQLVLIREGLRDVPAMKDLMAGFDDARIVALATHFAAQRPAPPTGSSLQPGRYAAGAEISRRGACGSCHLPGYVGQNQVPRLALQQEEYLGATLKMYRDAPAPGRDTMMSAVLRGMTDADLAALAHYFALHRP